jgi:hypothetical protein
MTLEQIIRAIPGWKSKTAQTILDHLQSENIPFVDTEKWTWAGIINVYIPETGKRFGRDGAKLLQDTMLASGEDWTVQQLSAGFALYDDEILELFKQLDAAGIVPGARHIARAIKRNVSILEQEKIPAPTTSELETLLRAYKLADTKALKIETYWDKFQNYKQAMTAWKGPPETEPEF